MENILFENRYEITIPFLRSLNKLSQKWSGKLRLWIIFFTKIWLAAFSISSAVVCVVLNIPSMFWFAVVLAVYLALEFIIPEVRLRKRFKRFASQSGCPVLEQTTRFGEKIEVESGNSLSTYSYEQIRYIEENGDRFYLWLGVDLIFILCKNAFTIGNINDFGAYINSKCSEKTPLWTKRTLNRELFKKHLTAILILLAMIIGSVLYLRWTASYRTSDLKSTEQAVQNIWGASAQCIAEVDVQNGAVIFYVNEQKQRINAMLLERSGKGYNYVTSHYYSIKDITEYNEKSGRLFETAEETLSFDNGKATVVYGIADKGWCDKNANADIYSQKYNICVFVCSDKIYYLYYRFANAADYENIKLMDACSSNNNV